MRSSDNAGLAIEGLTVRFGGLVAVDDVTLSVPTGRLTGLIGPNGAGKTTTFNAATGLVRPASGKVMLLGRDVSSAPPHRRAQRGLGRTFQRMELFDRLSVSENIAMGREARFAGRRAFGPFWHTASERREIGRLTTEAVEICGIESLTSRAAGELSTGQRRLVELARAVAGDFKVLLLDEPSSGLDAAETEHFGRILMDVVARRGSAVLLVEHDMSLVTKVCDYVYVLEFGKLLAEGRTREVLASASVKAAYLGTAVV